MEKVKITVFGIRDEAPAGTCSCGGACGSGGDKAMGEMFAEMVAYLRENGLGDRAEAQFVDVLEDDLSQYGTAQVMFRNGFSLPLVDINGVVRFYGGISNAMVYQEAAKFLGAAQ